jgi:hypothetical protein
MIGGGLRKFAGMPVRQGPDAARASSISIGVRTRPDAAIAIISQRGYFRQPIPAITLMHFGVATGREGRQNLPPARRRTMHKNVSFSGLFVHHEHWAA